MGNTLIKDNITGNIISLSNGFVPLGMKERGGILYIASYNPQTKEGELGTVPSPIIHYTYNNEAISDEQLNISISDIDGSNNENISISNRLNKQPLYILSDHVFHTGDKFIVILNLDKTSDETIRTFEDLSIQNSAAKTLEAHYPQISQVLKDEYTNKFYSKRGWFKIKLFAVNSAGESFELDNITNIRQEYYILNNNQLQKSPYWFIDSSDLSEEKQININKTRTQNLFNTYPNIQSGRLAIQFEEELPDKLDYLGNENFGKNLPQIYYTTDSNNDTTYYGIVHGFTYSNGGCPVMPDKIEITSANHKLYLPLYDDANQISVNEVGINKITLHTIVGERFNGPDEADLWLDGQGINVTYNEFPKTKENISSSEEHPTCPKSARVNGSDSIKAFVQKISADYTFLISKRRHSRDTYNKYLSYSNYDDNETDGLFFIKLDQDSLNIPVQLHVKLYTKDFKQETKETAKYVLYDEYDLPEFIPLVEMGFSGLTPPENPAQQYLDIIGDSIFSESNLPNKKFDLQLFNDVPSGYNQCFVIKGDNNDDKQCEYNQDNGNYIYGKYSEKDGTSVHNAKQLKTYIYPITMTTESIEANSSVTLDRDNVRFLWYSDKENIGDSYLVNKGKLTFDGGDVLPTVKSSRPPRLSVNNTAINKFLPIKWNKDDISETYKQARQLKIKAKNAKTTTNNINLTADGLKQYCIFNTNLTCLSVQLNTKGIDSAFYTGWYNGTDNRVVDLDPAWARGEEIFFKRELSLSNNSGDITATGTPTWNTYDTFPITIKSTRYDDTLFEHGCDFYPTVWNGIVVPGQHFRGYALGIMLSTITYMPFSTTTYTPFLGFLIASTPGFIKADGQDTTLFKLPLINYKHPLSYLYSKQPSVSFSNLFYNPKTTTDDLHSASTLNLLYNSTESYTDKYGWNFASDDVIYIKGRQYPTNYNGYTASFKMNASGDSNEIEISKIYPEYDDSDIEVNKNSLFTTYDNKQVLGIYNGSVDISIPVDYSNFTIETVGKITPKDGLHVTQDVSHATIERKTAFVSDTVISDPGTHSGYYQPVWAARIMESIEAQNILTSVQSNLFVNLEQSDLEYKNLSDFKLYHLLKTDGIWSNGSCVVNVPNVNSYNLLIIPDNYTNSLIPAKELKYPSGQQYKNSFCIDEKLLQITANKQITLTVDDNILQEGLYAFNFNYNYLNNYQNSAIDITINAGEQTIYKRIPFGQHVAVLYVKTPITITSIDIDIIKSQDINYEVRSLTLSDKTESDILYMKNFGLFSVNIDGSDAASIKLQEYKNILNEYKDNITWVEDNEILSNIVFPITFCFKELKDDKTKLGCLNTTYSGFQALPDYPNERIGGVYYLKDNTIAAFDPDTIPEDLQEHVPGISNYIQNTLFNQNIIIHAADYESSTD